MPGVDLTSHRDEESVFWNTQMCVAGVRLAVTIF